MTDLSPLVKDALGSLAQYIRAPRTELPMREWLDKEYNIRPHVGQAPVYDAIDAGGVNEIDVIAGKRSGKTHLARNAALYQTIGLSRRGWVLAPSWKLVDRIYMPIFSQIASSSVPIIQADRTARIIATSTGGVLEGLTWGSDFQIEGEGIHFCITDEAQQMPEAVYDLIRARLVGNYLWIRIGSPADDGRSFYEERAMELASALSSHRIFRWPTWVNPDRDVQAVLHIERQRLVDLRRELGKENPVYKKELAWFMRIRGGRTAKASDLVIGSFDKDIQVRPCPFDENLPVYLFVDPGWSPAHYAVCAYQPHPKGEALEVAIEPGQDELWQIDELYVQQTVTEEVIRTLKGRAWWSNVEKAVIDVTARQTNRQTGRREIDVWVSMVGFPILSQYVNINESVGALRSWCAASRIFHDPSCKHTIREYSLWKMMRGNRDIPGDAWNDALQATSYGLVKLYGHADRPTKPIIWQRHVNTEGRRWIWR